MNVLQYIKAATAALILPLLFVSSLHATVTLDVDDGLIGEKALAKIKEMGTELNAKTGVSTVIIAKGHLDQATFLEIKDRYLKTLNNPYLLWIFSKTYEDRGNVGINKLFSSPDLKDKYDEDSLFSPIGGSFTKLIVIQKSDSDPTAAAFLNGYADLSDMVASSYGVKLDSSIGHETETTINIARIVFYIVTLFFFIYYIRVKFFKKGKA